ncbi:hypothetical protein CK203_040657 [Vitis vinifera]|uniref:Uncharacterized protein n=1 Tax=Vitis vinifera TaxID=29760 RepID=A0A438HIU9_VITVI|nr:hypothetical protein CK203_040657 [Vitis vinifera]
MATSVSPTATSTHHTRGFPHTHSCPNSNLQPFVLSFPISCHRSSPSPIRFHPPSLPPRTASLRRRASTPSPPPPPESDPPPQNDPVPLTEKPSGSAVLRNSNEFRSMKIFCPKETEFPSLVATFSRFQDSIQIFFAVLFWLSLFFWASAWDGRNGGRPNKGSRLRR